MIGAVIEMYDQTVRGILRRRRYGPVVRELSPSQHSLIRSRLGGVNWIRMVPIQPPIFQPHTGYAQPQRIHE